MATDAGFDDEPRFARLISEARSGRTDSYRALLEAAAALSRRRVRAQLARFGRAEMTEDVVQEILLTMHLKLHTYDADRPFGAWLASVARHKAIDALRRSRRTVPLTEAAEPAIAPEADARLARRDLMALLGGLKPPLGEILYDLKVEGTSVKTLAQKHGLSESHVKVLAHRALRKLAAMLTKGEG